jgi:hypothetical protein
MTSITRSIPTQTRPATELRKASERGLADHGWW